MEKEAHSITTEQPAAAPQAVAEKAASPSFRPRRGRSTGRGSGRPEGRRNVRREERARPEFDQKIIGIRRVTRVVAGGRRFSFSVTLVLGNRRGSVGVGVGKASDTALAIDKAVRDAKKHMITIPISDEKRIAHDVSAKYCASSIEIRPAPGRGLVAGGAVRTVLELAGITDTSTKILSRSKNAINNARASILALSQVRA